MEISVNVFKDAAEGLDKVVDIITKVSALLQKSVTSHHKKKLRDLAIKSTIVALQAGIG
jgi:hypothetical protein